MGGAEDFRQAGAFAEAAFAGMVANQVPPTPENYAVWYAYATGVMPEVKRTIDILISNKQEFTAALNGELYQRFCDAGPQFNVLQETGDRLQYSIDHVMRYLKTASGDTKAFGQTLDRYSDELGGSLGSDELRTVVSGLILETQRVAERNRSLQERLTESSGEISELRQNLEVVRREALTDALTGIPNRKFFDTRLRTAAKDAMETGEPLCLIIADIDHFKKFNDTYGHQIGDQVLRLVARTLTDSVKGRDTPARYGGEEFAIVLPQTRLDDAMVLADQIRQTMMRRRIVRKETRDDLGTITLSIGAAGYRPGEPLTEIVRRADAALYFAKHNGRNRAASENDLEKPPAAGRTATKEESA
jgi:diguanylate cyclase